MEPFKTLLTDCKKSSISQIAYKPNSILYTYFVNVQFHDLWASIYGKIVLSVSQIWTILTWQDNLMIYLMTYLTLKYSSLQNWSPKRIILLLLQCLLRLNSWHTWYTFVVTINICRCHLLWLKGKHKQLTTLFLCFLMLFEKYNNYITYYLI